MISSRIILPLTLVVSMALVGCKSKAESLGDKLLEAGNITNAVQMYGKVEAKGDGSETFKDNYSLALIEMMRRVASKNVESDLVTEYPTMIMGQLEGTKNLEVLKTFGEAIGEIVRKKLETEVFVQEVDAFDLLNKVAAFAKTVNYVGFETLQAEYVDRAVVSYINKYNSETNNDIAAEYHLLAAKRLVGPNNVQLNEKLKEIRAKNISNILIFSEYYLGFKPSPLVDKNGYVFAFTEKSLKKNAAKLVGNIQIVNFSGEAVKFGKENFRLVSVEGDTVFNTAAVSKECADFHMESKCSNNLAFSYEGQFTPEYVLIRSKNGLGRKYINF
ncbi:hypothetical protein OAA91_00070 [Fibrobacterales bacterium]|nr:hypothetical protein [Fibrobacterales bacterium]